MALANLVHLCVDAMFDIGVLGGVIDERVESGGCDLRVLGILGKVGGVDGLDGFGHFGLVQEGHCGWDAEVKMLLEHLLGFDEETVGVESYK